MKKDFTCPFCNHTFPLLFSTTYQCYESSFSHSNTYDWEQTPDNAIFVQFYNCPHCNKTSIKIVGCSGDFENINIPVYPNSLAKQFPKYIPKAIRDDYEEAYSILNLSPKASATLSRRCLQGMIRDFYGIKKSRLIDEINELQSLVSNAQWKAIDGVRSIGNIGAHMEKDINMIVDVDPDEAQKLLKLIELLMDKWYIARHDEEELLSDIIAIADEKKSHKQSASNQ